MADSARFPIWAAIVAGAAVLLLLLATIFTMSADLSRNGEDFGTDPDDARNANTLDILSALFMDLGRYALGGAFIAAAALGGGHWSRAVFAVVGAAVLFPLNII